KAKSRAVARLLKSNQTGAGEGIRTLDPNLGKQGIIPSKYFSRFPQISLQSARGTVLLVFVGISDIGGNGRELNWIELK
ncbi:hypothetical protein, partial [Pseudochrobactrum sp. AO18b]|uniref:hypothetical protein n=1 Tax=Pseudochrobactrum sp. AO18b TaxID=1201036 RepID=UPI000527575F